MATPKLRFKEFDGDWSSQTLGNIAKFISGYAFDSEKFDENGRKLITPRNFTTYGRALFTEQNTKFTIESCDEKFVCRGNDLLILLTDLTQSCELLGKPILLPHLNEEILLNQRILKVEPNQDVIGKVFLLNFFLTENYLKHIKETSTGTTVRHSSHKILSKYEVFYPSKAEQTKIASFLSAVDEKISQLTQKHELLSQYKQGMMQKLFSQQIRFKADDGSEFGEWEINIIRDVFTNKSKNFNPQNEGNLPCIELEHLSQNTGKILGTIESCEQQSTKNLFEKNSVLFGKLRPYLRKFAKPKFKGVCSSEIWVLTGLKISNDYLFQFVQSEQFTELTNIQSGSKMPRADWNVIADSEIEFPCLEEQTKIANFLSAIDQKIEVVAEQIEQAKTWKKGLLQQMFV
ncbi:MULTISPECIES: restriction endonuclease subunit S [Acinetobacter]|uniref:Type I restriction modification DNA specificity domain-containing protein n=1 Tax=Acinetobacter parvus DSM 16617 = CIP 108168 TaxID=981333 RepID=N8RQE9_9GAMM|nr:MULTISPECIES: restriction endonuclease subunit S [Acinetobacter]ENU35789.1 hypothetical protein F988_01970 [Acinetobacter parvus DSM 16617 = CIP 108168]ENU88736.1 hypothetical protein F972_01826 [Acinetobacter sp. CIP 102529]MCU4393677.1 restriction endonuclease subunit S [Acinetobacter parvus]MCU4612648.1 restriction endonuclease subunit S [Acinetobacter parvus]